MRLVTFSMSVMLETEDENNPSTDTLIDNILLFTQGAIRNSTLNGEMDFGINIKGVSDVKVVSVPVIEDDRS